MEECPFPTPHSTYALFAGRSQSTNSQAEYKGTKVWAKFYPPDLGYIFANITGPPRTRATFNIFDFDSCSLDLTFFCFFLLGYFHIFSV